MTEVTTLFRTTPVQEIHINTPVWFGGQRCVGIADWKVGQHNAIYIDYVRKSDGEKIYKRPFYISGKDAQKYPLKPLKSHPNIKVYWIPLADMNILEYEDA